MKFVIALAFISAAFCGFLTPDFHNRLRSHAPFEVYEAHENPFRDYTEDQLRALFGVQLMYPDEIEIYEEPSANLPQSFDFRTNWKECVPAIRDQKSCGGCWAFSGAVTLSERFCIASQGAVSVALSAQDSLSCDRGNMACDGGYLDRTWMYYEMNGVVTEQCMPFVSESGAVPPCPGKCQDGSSYFKYKAKESRSFRGATAIKTELMANGPIQTGYNVYKDFMAYKSGIYVKTSTVLIGSHAVIIVGWGIENGVEYWIIQNSWGPTWGEEGYFRIKIGQCGIDANAYAGLPVL